ncbi:MAG: hypothetical protein ABWW70_04225 [Thermoproteota archaeon]
MWDARWDVERGCGLKLQGVRVLWVPIKGRCAALLHAAFRELLRGVGSAGALSVSGAAVHAGAASARGPEPGREPPRRSFG